MNNLPPQTEIELSVEFSQILLDAIDEGFKILGEGVSDVVYYYLKEDYGLDRSNITKKHETFTKGLENLFGVGAAIIEREILKKLYAKLGLKYEEDSNKTYTEHIKLVYKIYRRKSK